MPIPEKPANLSPGLLTQKDAPSPAGAGPDSADRPTVDRRPPGATVTAEAQATMLSRKGAASAAGFRPHYWSYDHAETPPSSTPSAIVSLFPEQPRPVAIPATEAAAPPQAEPAAPTQAEPAASAGTTSPPPAPSRASPLVVIFGCIALAASGSLYWLASSRPTVLPVPNAAGGLSAEPAPGPIRHDEPQSPANDPHPVTAVQSATARVVEAPPQSKPASPASIGETVAAPVAPKAPSAAPAVVPSLGKAPVVALSLAEIGNLVARGDELLATGDIAGSRLFYQRAAEQGSGPAATAVGKTFDPLFLARVEALGIRGDAATAARWYRKASAAGDRQGQIRLEQLLARFPQ